MADDRSILISLRSDLNATHIILEIPDRSWRPLGKPHRMFLLAETENQLTRKDLDISREIEPPDGFESP